MADAANWETERHRTAIGRPGLSMPTRQALGDGVLADGDEVLDYGSGRGQDVGLLQRMGFSCIGWDPYFNPHERPCESDVVFLNYVLNVIENGAERNSTLLAAWTLTRKTLVVATRLHWEARRLSGVPLEDGVLTSRSTFQHLFEPAELKRLVESTTGSRVVSPTPGVVYAFRRDEDRLSYLAERTLPKFDWAAAPDSSAALKAVVKFTEDKGRLPVLDEIPERIVGLIGRLSTTELHRLVMKAADPIAVSDGARRSTLDTLLYLGVELFTGRSQLSSLPLSVKLDVRKFFGSYKEACRRSDRLLLKLRDDSYVRGAMRNSVGKLTPSALYVHRRAMSSMPVVLRLYEHCGSVAVGRIPDFTLVKLSHDKRAVSWLGYPDFDSDPHPRTSWSFQVTFPELATKFQDFSHRANRPLLHRKEEFLAPEDPQRLKYERLTRSEVKAGLYANPHMIGTEDGWAAELLRCGVELRGHRLVRLAL